MGILQADYERGLPRPSPGTLPNPAIEPRSPALQVDSLPSEPPGKLTFERFRDNKNALAEGFPDGEKLQRHRGSHRPPSVPLDRGELSLSREKSQKELTRPAGAAPPAVRGSVPRADP